MTIPKVLIFIMCVSFLDPLCWAQEPTNNDATSTSKDPIAVAPEKNQVPENLVLVSSGETSPKHIFIADKSSRTLTVWTHEKEKPKLLGAYPMDIGESQGDKTNEGDKKTPEGIYFFQEKKEGSSLDFTLYGKRAFTLDYPNLFDHKAGKTGYGIWLHAVPDTTSLLRGSKGCVVVRNDIIDQLTPLIRLKSTPLLILDKVKYVTSEQVAESRKTLQDWMERWRTAWESKDLDNYLSFYSDEFKAQGKNKAQWRKYKKGLNERYTKIGIEVKDPFLLTKMDEAVITFIQDYQSDGLKDLGEKTLYVKKDVNGEFKILTENWRPISKETLVYHSAVNSQ